MCPEAIRRWIWGGVSSGRDRALVVVVLMEREGGTTEGMLRRLARTIVGLVGVGRRVRGCMARNVGDVYSRSRNDVFGGPNDVVMATDVQQMCRWLERRLQCKSERLLWAKRWQRTCIVYSRVGVEVLVGGCPSNVFCRRECDREKNFSLRNGRVVVGWLVWC